MKKYLLAIGLATVAVPFMTSSASAHSYDYGHDESSYSQDKPDLDKCDRIAQKLERINAKFDQNNEWRVDRQQRLIDRQNEENCPVEGTIVDNLVANGNFTTLVTAVKAAGLVDALSAPGETTVFAPTDQAFAALPAGTVEALVQDVPALTNILTQHVISGSVDAEMAAEVESATALNGNKLTVTTDDDGGLYINGVHVVVSDIMTTNGIIHVIDSVLLS